MTTTDRPTAPYARTTELGTYIHVPPPPDTNWSHGTCIAYTRRRAADLMWEVKVVGDKTPVGEYPDRVDAVTALCALTGVAPAEVA